MLPLLTQVRSCCACKEHLHAWLDRLLLIVFTVTVFIVTAYNGACLRRAQVHGVASFDEFRAKRKERQKAFWSVSRWSQYWLAASVQMHHRGLHTATMWTLR